MSTADKLTQLDGIIENAIAGKASVAEAITAKGVDTLPDASFDTLAINVGLIEGGSSQIEFSTGGFPNVEAIESEDVKVLRGYAFEDCTKLKRLILPNASAPNGPTWVGKGCTSLEEVLIGAHTGAIPNAFFREIKSLKKMQLGSVGHAITGGQATSFYGDTQSGLTITLYVNPSASLPLSNHPFGATNATIVYRSSTTGDIIATY